MDDKEDQDALDSIESHIDPEIWRMEVARVAPKLKLKMSDDVKDWRDDLQQVQ